MNLPERYAKIVKMGIDSSSNLPDLNDMTDRGRYPLKPWTASKTVGTINMIKRYDIQDEETFVERFQSMSKIPLETLTEQVYNHQKKYFGRFKYDKETIFKYTYCCVVLNSLQGNSTERKFAQWARARFKLMDPPPLLDEKFHTDKLELNEHGRMVGLISIKPNSFHSNCLQYRDVFAGLQFLSEITKKPWKIYFREKDEFKKIDLSNFAVSQQNLIGSWSNDYSRNERELIRPILQKLPL